MWRRLYCTATYGRAKLEHVCHFIAGGTEEYRTEVISRSAVICSDKTDKYGRFWHTLPCASMMGELIGDRARAMQNARPQAHAAAMRARAARATVPALRQARGARGRAAALPQGHGPEAGQGPPASLCVAIHAPPIAHRRPSQQGSRNTSA